MITGLECVDVLRGLAVSHVVWIPDSETGTWNSALAAAGTPTLIRATREGEAIGIAAGLMLGGARPLVVIQCTGLFEAGDALRNVVHDLKLPLALVVGVRSYTAHQQGRSMDSCPIYTEPILRAWNIPQRMLARDFTVSDFESALREVLESGVAGAVLLAE